MPRLPGNVDVITQPLYDRETVLAAGTASLSFFTRAVGQNNAAGVAKTLLDTFMPLAGQLPSPWTFEIKGVAVKLPNDVIDLNAKEILDTGFLVLTIGSKDWLTLPLDLVPGGAGLSGFSGAATTVAATTIDRFATTNGVPDPRAIYMLTRPINILENENFRVDVTWAPAVTPTVNVPMKVILHGELTRSVQ